MSDTIKRIIEIYDEGFGVLIDSKLWRKVFYQSVLEIAAFKRDTFSYDELCLGFRTETEGEFISVGEEDKNFEELLGILKIRFNGLKPDWFSEVMHSAFTTNWTTIWLKAERSCDYRGMGQPVAGGDATR